MRAVLIAVAALTLASAPALAQSKVSPMPNTAGSAPAQAAASSEGFAKMAASSDMFEVESSKLAAQKSQNPELKKFAEHMIEAHTKTSKELASLVGGTTTGSRSAAITLPKEMDAPHQEKLKTLQSASGTKFDQAYHEQQVEAHKEAISLFSSYSQTGDDPELKSWAAKTLPDLKEHLEMIQKVDIKT